MSEQTANLCTTDAAESLRAVVAERDREIERLKEGQSILIFARDEQKRLANEYRDLWSRAAVKAQPSGVVQWPDADEIMQMAFEEGQPSEDASGYYFELEEFDLFIQRLMEEVARLNSSPASSAPSHGEQVRHMVPDGWRPVPVESLSNILRLIDPEPVRLPSGKTMVFENPLAAALMTRISAEVRAMLAATPSAGSQEKG